MNSASSAPSASSAVSEALHFLEREWDSEKRNPRSGSMQNWLELVVGEGWAAPTWPKNWWGRGLSDTEAKAIVREFRRVGAIGAGQERTNISAVTIFSFGSDELKRMLIPGFLTGKLKPCLLYSEPGAGSDLASVRTRADLKDGAYIINGQKVWTTNARTADYGLLLARTDWNAPKHKGLSFFFLDMRQSGITVRPLHQITGERHFNEVFLEEARALPVFRVGAEGDGWRVLQTALAVERLMMGGEVGEGRRAPTGVKRLDLIGLARDVGKLRDPAVRQDLAGVMALRKLNALNLLRSREEMAEGNSSPLMSLAKLEMSRILHQEARLFTALLGPRSMLDGETDPVAAEVNYRTAHAYMTSIGGGTDQIQRNIIAERVLGLPRDTDTDRDIPFKESLAVRKDAP
jgi:alkylation response protein AidB-like acyl-CoA dehydrogenase